MQELEKKITVNGTKNIFASFGRGRFFTPVIASSLAIMLGANVASADCFGLNAKFCAGLYDGNGSFSGPIPGLSTIEQSFSFKNDNNYYAPTWDSNVLNEIKFVFISDIKDGVSGKYDSAKGVATITAASISSPEVIVGLESLDQDTPFKIGNNGGGKIVVDFSALPQSRVDSFTLVARGNKTDWSFMGNIDIILGQGSSKNPAFNGAFDHNVLSTITITSPFDGTKSMSGWVFNNDETYLKGDFDASAGINYLHFNGNRNSIRGSIYAKKQGVQNNISFGGDGSYIDGVLNAQNGGENKVIFSKRDSYASNVHAQGVASLNHITFEGASSYISASLKASDGGKNLVVLKNSTSSIKTKVEAIGAKSVNDITFEGEGGAIAQNVLSNGVGAKNSIIFERQDSHIDGAIQAQGGGHNTIELKDRASYIAGNIESREENSGNSITFGQSDSYIKGNIIAQNKGVNKIIFLGDNSRIESPAISAQTGGVNNIILANGLWGQLSNGSKSGTLTTEGGTNNIVLRASTNDNTKAIYTISTTQSGTSNIVLQNTKDITAHIDYAGAATATLMLANSNTGNDDLESVDMAKDLVLGKTYQDGIKFTLADNNSLVATYGEAYKKINNGNLLTIASKHDHANASNQTTIAGLAVGSLTALTSSNNAAAGITYNLTINTDSALVGSIDLSKDANMKVNLTMQKGSKFILNARVTHLQGLSIDNAQYNKDDALSHTLEQSNTVIDLATGGNVLSGLETRSDFNLLNIGQYSQTGLSGENALFRVLYKSTCDK